MSLEEEKNQEYWEGVRDTVRLLIDFLKWREKNPAHSKTLRAYIKEAQELVASKTSPPLADILGVPFRKS
ncbi:MAG: hypothetical protein ACTSW4_04010 [Candidatus Ranarchaeia archaeon]